MTGDVNSTGFLLKPCPRVAVQPDQEGRVRWIFVHSSLNASAVSRSLVCLGLWSLPWPKMHSSNSVEGVQYD